MKAPIAVGLFIGLLAAASIADAALPANGASGAVLGVLMVLTLNLGRSWPFSPEVKEES